MHGSKISSNTNPEPMPDHDTVVARCLAAAAPDASAEAELAAAGTILGFKHKGGMWTRTCPSCRSTMWLMDTDERRHHRSRDRRTAKRARTCRA